jgi:hypothetical protein
MNGVLRKNMYEALCFSSRKLMNGVPGKNGITLCIFVPANEQETYREKHELPSAFFFN